MPLIRPDAERPIVLNVAAAVGVVLPTAEGGGDDFEAPSIDEFFPEQLIGVDTFWGPTRIDLIGLLMTLALLAFFGLAFRRPQDLERMFDAYRQAGIPE